LSLAPLAARPGTLTWLALHDLRQSWRRFMSVFGSLRPRTSLLIVGVAVLAFHLISIPVALWFRTAEPGGANALHFYPALASAVLFVMPWLVSQALTSTTRALYTRNDLDLLLASPLPPRLVLAARALAIGCESIGSVAIFLLPIANMNALLVGWQWLAVYPALVATGLICTSLGIGLTLLLFRIAGPRRTRLVSQIVATIIGAGFIFTLQALHVLPEGTRLSIVAAIESPGNSIIFDKSGWLWLPVRAAAGEPVALILWCSISIVIFAATALLLGERFALSAVHSGGTAASVSRKRNKSPVRFRPGLGRALRLKEWRLLGRDPWLLSQIMLQVIYTLPVSIVIWRSQGPNGSMAISIAPAIVVIAAQISASLAWLTISSEDAPEFLATAPVSRRVIERRKLEAIAVPLSCFLAAPLLALAWASVELALYTLVFTAGAAASTAFLNFWHPMPGRRVAVLRRHSQSKLIAMLEHLLSLLWAVAMVLCVVDSWYALVPLGMIAGILWLNRPRNAVATAHVARQASA
jgi:ABC-2 type transport system permease protein